MNLREIKAQEGFGPSTSVYQTDALTNWATNPPKKVVFFYLSIINKMNLREIKAQEGFGPSISSLLDWRSNQLSYRATAANFIIFTYSSLIKWIWEK